MLKVEKYIRYESTDNILYALKKEFINKNSTNYPSLENDLFLQNKIISTLEYIRGFLKGNRPDFFETKAYDNELIKNQITLIRKGIINKAVKTKVDDDISSACLQEKFGEIVLDIYDKNKNNIVAYCYESSYIFYKKLCNSGIDNSLMRIISFRQSMKDCKNSHSLILYSSVPSLFTNIENICGYGDDNIHADSYSKFIDLLVDTKDKDNKQKLFIIDPWSKDNKIVDLMYQDSNLYELIKKSNPSKKITKTYVTIVINSILNESSVLNDLEYDKYTNHSLLGVSIFIDKPPIPTSFFDDDSSDSDDSMSSNSINYLTKV